MSLLQNGSKAPMTCQSLTRTSSLEQPTIRSTMRNRKKSGRARPNCNLQISFARVAMQMKLKRLFGRFSITVTMRNATLHFTMFKNYKKRVSFIHHLGLKIVTFQSFFAPKSAMNMKDERSSLSF